MMGDPKQRIEDLSFSKMEEIQLEIDPDLLQEMESIKAELESELDVNLDKRVNMFAQY